MVTRLLVSYAVLVVLALLIAWPLCRASAQRPPAPKARNDNDPDAR